MYTPSDFNGRIRDQIESVSNALQQITWKEKNQQKNQIKNNSESNEQTWVHRKQINIEHKETKAQKDFSQEVPTKGTNVCLVMAYVWCMFDSNYFIYLPGHSVGHWIGATGMVDGSGQTGAGGNTHWPLESRPSQVAQSIPSKQLEI